MSDELRYGIIKYNKKENTSIIINSNRTMIYDSRVGFLDLKALSLKDELEREDINKLIAYMKPLMINATDRNTINHDSYQFYFNKLLTLNNIKIQNDLTKEMVKAKGLKQLSNIGGIIGWGLVITSYSYPDSIIKTVEAVAMSASNMLNRANTLVNVGYGEDLPSRFPDGQTWTKSYLGTSYTDGETGIKSYMGNDYTDLRSDYTDLGTSYTESETWTKSYPRSGFTDLKNGLVNGARKLVTPLEKLKEEYINEEMGISNRKGGKFLTRLYGNNEELREEIINFVRDKKRIRP